MADPSTTPAPIRILITGDRWARRQLRSGIKDVSVASELRKLLTLVRVVFIDTLAISELDSRLLHNHGSDSESDCGRPLGWTPATQWYKVRPCRIKAHEVAVFCAGCIRYQASHTLLDRRYLHDRWTDFDSVCGRLLGMTPAFQQYKVRLCHIETQDIAVFCGEDLYSSPGDILLDGRLLHIRGTDLAALCGSLLDSTPATRRYKVRLYRIRPQEIGDSCGGCLYTYSGDPRARWLIPPQPRLRF